LDTQYADFEVVVYDNGSTDGSVAWLEATYPEIKSIALGRHLGFSAANNAGLRRALTGRADYAVLLNNDQRVEPDWLHALVSAAETDPTAAICQARQRMLWGYRNQLTTLLEFYQQKMLRDLAQPIRHRRFLTRNHFALQGTVAALGILLGKPVVDADTCATAEIVEDQRIGLLYHYGNPEDLAEKVATLLANPAWAAELGRTAREVALSRFPVGHYVNEVLAVYQQVTASKTGARSGST
jgi:glycosyltransferase involved in cell wall biosynthesis